ncbi:MAG: prepilin-type N-terminal cleavage/methylation domain-containing protein [Rhodocyclaceae bacterium]|nr:MAG: prepilin-type N-terminal cleavage/methylation domain-containing protein [Rhodocyclaceae bacterium]
MDNPIPRYRSTSGEPPATRRRRGFSLVELLITIAVAGIFLALAVPTFAEFIRESRLSSTIGVLASDMDFARTEAIKRNGRVLLCAKAAATDTCAGAVGAAASWANGWLVCFDAVDNTSGTTASDDVCDPATVVAGAITDPNPMRVGNTLPSGVTLQGSTGIVRFNGIGAPNAAATFTLTSNTGGVTSSRIATIAATGHVRKYKP